MDRNSRGIYKCLFLTDALGALVSAFFLGIVLVRFEHLVGMPVYILNILAIIPCFFAAYSLFCYFFVKSTWRHFLKMIAIANSMYCVTTVGLVIYYFPSLTFWGVGYFVLELIIIFSLVSIELRAASK